MVTWCLICADANVSLEPVSTLQRAVIAVAYRSCPSPARRVAKFPSNRLASPIQPAAQILLAVEAPRKRQTPLVTKSLFCLPTMTSLRPKEPCRPRNRPTVQREKKERHLHRSLAMSSKYRQTRRAVPRSLPPGNRPPTSISSVPSKSYKRFVWCFFCAPLYLACVVSE